MNITLDKNRICKRFERSIAAYNNEAFVQRNVAGELIDVLANSVGLSFHRVLEIGCGTGFLTRELLRSFRPDYYEINDLSALMNDEISKITRAYNFYNWSFRPGDAEKISFSGAFDLVLSSSAFQWFQNIPEFFKTISSSVFRGGILAFSTFGKENFREFSAAGLNYPSAEELTGWLSHDFKVLKCSGKIIPVYFATPYDVLKHIRLTGVNGIQNTFWSRQQLSGFEMKYRQRFSNAEGAVSLTYHPIIIIAQRK